VHCGWPTVRHQPIATGRYALMPLDMLSLSSLSMETATTTAEGLGQNLVDPGGYCDATTDHDIDFAKMLEVKPRPMQPIHTNRSFDERALSELISSGLSSPRPLRQLETVKSSECLEGLLLSPSIRSGSLVGTPNMHHSFEPHPMISDGWDALRRSLVYFRSKPVGTIAAMDPSEDSLNYNQVFICKHHSPLCGRRQSSMCRLRSAFVDINHLRQCN
jgi:hypothetical protein